MFGIDQQVQQTADAYRGKPQMLQQKYAQNQQLIDLLALQKLKSDKEEAARQLALSANGKPPTIADQRESEALDNAKKEVVQEQAGVMQQKMQQQQDAQKKLLQSAGAPQMPAQAAPQPQQPPAQGLAGLPAPNIQGMAGGGIVAFSGKDGDQEVKEKGQREKDRTAITNTIEQLIAAGKDVLSAPVRGVAGAAESVITRPLRAVGIPLPYLPESFYGGDRGSLTPYADKLAKENAANQAINASRQLPADEATPAYASAVAKQAEARNQAPPPASPPPSQAASQGTGGGAPMGNAPGTVGFGIQSLIGSKTPDQAAMDAETRAAAAANFTPEEVAGKRAISAEEQAFYERNKLAEALISGAGYTSGAGAIANMGQTAVRGARNAMQQRNAMENQLIDMGPESRKIGTKAGEARFKDVVLGMSQGVDAAVKQAANATAAASNTLRQKELDFNHAMERIRDFQRIQEKGLADLDKNYTVAKSKLGVLPGTKIAPEIQRELDILDTQYALGRERLQKTPAEINVLRQRIGMGSYDGYSIVGVQPAAPKP
jgi:hypothetical protein